MTRFRFAAPAAISALLLALPATAHHGWSWAEEEQPEKTGTIESISFAPPHPSMTAEIDGETWQVDLGNPTQTKNSGFAEGLAAEGDEITILGNRSLDQDENRIKAVRIEVNGETYDMYPERIQSD